MTSNFYFNFLYFIIYSVMGWVMEVIVCSRENKKFVNRGFLNGPLCPIYGSGALLILGFLTPLKGTPFLVFLFGIVFTSTLEYFTSFVMEKLFHARWWDYSKRKYNLHGRICLFNSIAFGVFSMIIMYFVHPAVADLVAKLSYFWVQVYAIVILMVMTADATLTIQTVTSLNERMAALKELSGEIKTRLASGELYSDIDLLEQAAKLRLHARLEENEHLSRLSREYHRSVSGTHVFHKRLINAFPEMHSTRFDEQLGGIRRAIEEHKQDRKNKR